jgi:hypothetical protein
MPKDKDPNANKPVDVNFRFNISEDLETLYGRDDLNFDVILSGKAKTVDLPGNRYIDLTPGLKVTFVNLDTGEMSRAFNIAGPSHATVNEDGSTDFILTGRHLSGDPFILGGEGGLVFTAGNFSFSLNADLSLKDPLSGRGRVFDFLDVL